MLKVHSRQGTLGRWKAIALVVVAVGAGILAWHHWVDSAAPTEPPDQTPSEPDAGRAVVKLHKPVVVPANRSADVPDGFRGDVHHMLHGRTPLEATAHWTPIEKDRLRLEAPDEILGWYTGLRPAVPRATYSPRDFSAFLPASGAEVGQIWAVDPDRIKVFLQQFHPNPRTHLVATGRRAGPDGSFALLRAVSPTHAEIVFRVHTEFYVTPPAAGDLQAVHAWLTPAYFHGQLLVNTTTGTVEHFELALPTEKALNVFLTVNPSLLNIPKLGHDIIRVDRMALSGGDERLASGLIWTKSVTPAEAARRLARVFYKFEEIDWVPVDQVADRARGKDRPILAIVSWGSTDDQSC